MGWPKPVRKKSTSCGRPWAGVSSPVPGLGFAVVAGEVRNLAGRCAQTVKTQPPRYKSRFGRASAATESLATHFGLIATSTKHFSDHARGLTEVASTLHRTCRGA